MGCQQHTIISFITRYPLQAGETLEGLSGLSTSIGQPFGSESWVSNDRKFITGLNIFYCGNVKKPIRFCKR